LDFINFLINFYAKEKLVKRVSVETIVGVIKENDKIVLKLANNEELIMSAEIPQQKDMIYILFIYMKKVNNDMSLAKDSTCKIKEHNLNVTYSKEQLKNLIDTTSNQIEVELNNFKLDELK
jgi:hypothetical protein